MTSEPSVYDQVERLAEHVDITGAAIAEKAGASSASPFLADEWTHVVKALRRREPPHAFREIVLLDHFGKGCARLSLNRFTRRR